MEATILRQKVVEALNSGDPIDMIFITADRRRGTGGKLITCQGWQVEALDLTNGIVKMSNPANTGIHIHPAHIDLIQFFNGKRVIN